jgi:hypothetical protein
VNVTSREAGRKDLPITWVAIDPFGQAVGALGLGRFDLGERRDRSPWVLGTIVAAQYRGMGVRPAGLRLHGAVPHPRRKPVGGMLGAAQAVLPSSTVGGPVVTDLRGIV